MSFSKAQHKAWYVKNRPRLLKLNRRYYQLNKLQYRAYQLQDRYGISLNEYSEMFAKQKGKCAICKQVRKVLHIDHDHKTGRVRGLLCGLCNRGLGMFRDSKTLLAKALTYIGEL